MLWVSAPPPLAWTEPQAVSLPSEVLLAGVGGDLALAIRHLGALQPSFKLTHHAQTLLGCGTSRASREGRREAMQTPLGDSLPSGPRVGGGSRQVSWALGVPGTGASAAHTASAAPAAETQALKCTENPRQRGPGLAGLHLYLKEGSPPPRHWAPIPRPCPGQARASAARQGSVVAGAGPRPHHHCDCPAQSRGRPEESVA